MSACNETNLSHCQLCLEDRIVVGITAAVADCVSFLCCLFIIFIIFVYKKYVFSTQRLILYLTIAVLLYSITRIVMDSNAKTLFNNDPLCVAVAFGCQYLATSILIAVNCILFEVYIKTILNKNTGKLEWLYPFVIFLLPAPITVIPYLTNNYGPSRTICSIQDFNPQNCTHKVTGIVLHAILWWVPVCLTIIGLGVGYAIALIHLSVQSKRYSSKYDPDWKAKRERTKEDLKYFRYYPPVLMLIEMVPIADSIYNFFRPDNPVLALTIISHMTTGLFGGFIGILFTLDPHTWKRLKLTHLRAACLLNICRKDDVKEYPALISTNTDSLHI